VQHQSDRRSLSKCLLAAGMLALALFAVAFTSESAHAQSFTTVYTFPGGSQGYGPYDIIVAPDGTIFGAADYDSCACNLIFTVSNGSETVLHRFTVPSGYELVSAQGLLLSGNGEVLYGTTPYGGVYTGNCGGPQTGCGFAFAYNLSTKKYKLLHDFSGSPSDGADPAGVQVDASGNLYGATFGGGTDYNGTIYEITTTGVEKVLYSFGNPPDGAHPNGGLVGYSGKLYGVTNQGGANVCNNGGCGAIFEISPGGEKVLYNFTGGADGQNPYELIGDGHGNFYGVSRSASNVVDDIFKIDASGQFSSAYNGYFAAYMQWVIPGPNGTLYGVASGGNPSCEPNGCGQIFQLTPTGNGNGNIKILHEFSGPDGAIPQLGSLVLKNGALYGSTAIGGSSNQGTIFKLVP